jgi:hypothetical protein
MFTKTDLPPLPQELQDLALEIFNDVSPNDYNNLGLTPYAQHIKYNGGMEFLLKTTGLIGLTSGLIHSDIRFREFRKYFETFIKIPFHIDLRLGDRIDNRVEGPVDQCLHRFNSGPLLKYPLTKIRTQLYANKPSKFENNFPQWASVDPAELYHGIYDPDLLTKSEIVIMDKNEVWWIEYQKSMVTQLYDGYTHYELTVAFPHNPNITLEEFYNFGKIDL